MSLPNDFCNACFWKIHELEANGTRQKILRNAPINVKPAGGGRRGIGRDFDIFQKIAVKFPTPGQKCEVKYN